MKWKKDPQMYTLFTNLQLHTENARACPISLQIFHAIVRPMETSLWFNSLWICEAKRNGTAGLDESRWKKRRHPVLGFISLQHLSLIYAQSRGISLGESAGGRCASSLWDWFSQSHFYTHSYTPRGAPEGRLLGFSAVPDPLSCASASEPAQQQSNREKEKKQSKRKMWEALKCITIFTQWVSFTVNPHHDLTISLHLWTVFFFKESYF